MCDVADKEKVMVRRTLIVLASAIVIATLAHAQYSLYLVNNGEFETSIDHWYTGFENIDHPSTWGTAEWSPDYGGSAHMTVSGAPSFVELYQPIQTFLCPGDTITAHIYKDDMSNAGEVNLRIGSEWDLPFGQRAVSPTGAGEYDVSLVCDKFYAPGTILRIVLVVWPGSGEAWVHYVRLGRGGSLALADDGHRGSAHPRSAAGVRAVPTPARTSVLLSFDLTDPAPTQIKIFDATGSLVKQLSTQGSRGLNEVRWDGTDNSARRLAAGMYYYTVTSESGSTRTGKLVLTE